jgi:hypothetical protein
VAIAAVDADAPDVMGVAELNGLLHEHVLVRVEAAKMDHADHHTDSGDEESEGNDAEPGVDVGLTMEELTHRVDVRVVPRWRAPCPPCSGSTAGVQRPKPTPMTASAERSSRGSAW